MGVILYKMLYGSEPFSGRNEKELMESITHSSLEFPENVSLAPDLIKKSAVSDEIKKILKKTLKKDEGERIKFSSLYNKIDELTKKRLM